LITGINNLESGGRLTVFPNPANNLVKIEMEYPLNGLVKAEVRDISGKLVCSRNLAFLNGESELQLPESLVKEGVYTLCLNFSEKRVTKPFFIAR
jgi:hypothetical protein